MHDWLQSSLALRIGYALLHSIWQGAAITAAAGAILWMLRRKTSATRYLVSAAAMLGLVMLPLITFVFLNLGSRSPLTPPPALLLQIAAPTPNVPTPIGVSNPQRASASPAGPARQNELPVDLAPAPVHRLSQKPWLESNLPYAVLLWVVGVLVLSLWHLGGWVAVQRLRIIDTRKMPPHVESLLATLTKRLGIRRTMAVLESPHIDTPILLGLWKPLILLPPALLLGLAPGQLEALLAHELAHVRRYDYFSLLLQRTAETLLFYHPCVWWLSRHLRLEQEQCCDDIALAIVGDRRQYAGALAAVEEVRSAAVARMALAASGSAAHELMQRIARLLRIDAPPAPRRVRVAGAALILSTIFLALLTLSLAAKPPAILPVAKAPDEITVTVTDFNSGKPLANATVRININQDQDHPIDSKVTGADGLVRLAAANSAAWTQLTVTATGAPWATGERYWYPTRNAPTPPAHFDITLQNAITMGGTAVNDANQPLAGAQLQLVVNADAEHHNGLFNFVADAAGKWTCAGIPEHFQSVDIAVFHPDCLGDNGGVWFENVTDLSALRAGTAVFKLPRGIPIDGTVRGPDGKPIPTATIGYGSGGIGKIPVKPDGSFHLGVLPEKTSIVTVFAPGFAPDTRQVTVGTAPVTLNFDLVPGKTVRGRVVDAQGKPVAGATVQSSIWRSTDALHLGAKTDQDGNFTLTDAPADEINVGISKPGFPFAWAKLKAGADNHALIGGPALFRFSVSDAASGAPINDFQIVQGVVQNPPDAVQSWDREDTPQALPAATPGHYELHPTSAHAVIRIEAAGYFPEDHVLVDGEDYAFKLTPGKGLRGVVRSASGQPVGDAEVIVIEAKQTLEVQNGVLGSDGRHEFWHRRTAADGTFTLLPMKNKFQLLILADAGYARLADVALEKSPDITLTAWATIEGTVRRNTQPLPNAVIEMYYEDSLDADHLLSMEGNATADAAGHFTLKRVFAQSATLGRHIELGNATSTTTSNVSVSPKAGETLRDVAIGGSGRPVIGRIAVPAGMEPIATLETSGNLDEQPSGEAWSPPVEVMDMNPADTAAWWTAWNKSEEGKKVAQDQQIAFNQVRHFPFRIAPDGTFRIEDVPPGRYILDITAFKASDAAAPPTAPRQIAECIQEIIVPTIPNNISEDPFNAGLFATYSGRNLVAGDVVPPFAVTTADGKALSLADLKGKFVLVDVWHTLSPTFRPDIPSLTATWNAHHDDSRFAMLGLAYDTFTAAPLKYIAAKKFPWPSAVSVRATLLTRLFPLTKDGSSAWLIGPDGKVVADHLQGNQIKAAVDKALQN